MKTFLQALNAPGIFDTQVRNEIEKLLSELPDEAQKQIAYEAIQLLRGEQL